MQRQFSENRQLRFVSVNSLYSWIERNDLITVTLIPDVFNGCRRAIPDKTRQKQVGCLSAGC